MQTAKNVRYLHLRNNIKAPLQVTSITVRTVGAVGGFSCNQSSCPQWHHIDDLQGNEHEGPLIVVPRPR